MFAIESLSDKKCAGSISLLKIYWTERRGDTGVSLWDTADWGKGYASDAMRILLKFAFEELNLHRVRLHNGVYEFNSRAIKLYEKCGFTKEGIRRKEFYHRGKWWDVIDMAILDEDYFSKKP